MFIQHSEIKLGRPVPLENGPIARVLAQTQDSNVVFDGPSGEGVMPASEFFQTHREALPSEIAAEMDARPAMFLGRGHPADIEGEEPEPTRASAARGRPNPAS